MRARGKSLSFFDEKKIQRLAKKASDKAVEKATAYLWKTARNSVKKTSGQEKKYDLKIFLGQREDGRYETVEHAQKYLARAKRSNEHIVQRDTKKDVRNPQSQGKYRFKKPSLAGRAPKSHKTQRPGWRDYWLKEAIRHDKKGRVFVNPVNRQQAHGISKSLPLVIEEGGQTVSHIKILEGYYAYKKYFKNGKVSVSYRPVYTHKTKKYNANARPFLKPALENAAKKLIEILKNSIK